MIEESIKYCKVLISDKQSGGVWIPYNIRTTNTVNAVIQAVRVHQQQEIIRNPSKPLEILRIEVQPDCFFELHQPKEPV